MLFAVGEELSWGQRILGIETPEELELINNQDEQNIHNIGGALKVLNLIIMGIGGAGSIAYVIADWLELDNRLHIESCLFIPPFFLSTWYLIVFLYRLFRILILPDAGFTITKYAEWTELCFAFGLFFFAWLVARRLTVAKRQADEMLEASPTV